MHKIVLVIAISGCFNLTYAQVDSTYFPISLSSFSAGTNGRTVKLEWKTVCYLSYARFQVQKSADGISYATLYSFTADKLRCRQPFYYEDSSIKNAGSIYYRITVGNINGVTYHSKIANVNFDEASLKRIWLYPSISNSSATVKYISTRNEKLEIRIINSSGKLMQKQTRFAGNGVNNYLLNLSAIPKGAYWISVDDSKGRISTVGFIKL